MIASLSFKTGDLIFFFCVWKSPDRFPTGRGLSLGRAWASRSLWAWLRLQFWKAEAAKSRALPTAFRPSRAGTTLAAAFKAQFLGEFKAYACHQYPFNLPVDEKKGVLKWWEGLLGSDSAVILPVRYFFFWSSVTMANWHVYALTMTASCN